MLIDREIKPGVSLGGIKLGESVDLYLDKLSTHYLVRDDRETSWAFVGDELISIAYDADRLITTVCANSRFQGSYAGLIWPGMTVLQVIQNTHAQTEYAGCIVINGIDGVGLPLPAEHDDFENLGQSIPDETVLEYICVFQETWGKRRRKKQRGK
ncbi:hypothetical protein KDH83_18980 [Achromobacter sp. Marseille-Q0513]|uniref:hypothetical protein n=1 Tax=Achromobacter sp. Marseille-Q0513 TaxID=2829161 RepID=UPI001B97E88D|nr:hypothetical protein [Achromobacter sp. Marseille-Q0513]MBR8655393.1 hypothetical protein [Achromobacter sp. Marseille-Q0513]